ncbi:hypothetical protein [Nocardioides dongxiaopingii]|uniref:hypothetical protein n=1 Tax=Nocardioides dongxiaopingii TaxID=2576036 RepID=UPI0010C770CE|nr:hypothetical protein [Nocardioides dongxiaopingii]
MCFRHVRVLVAALISVATLSALPSTSAATVSSPDTPRTGVAHQRYATRDGGIQHRVVWDQFRRGRAGIHLRSARLDGTDIRRVYDSAAGFTLNPTLDGSGRRVAFGTCCRDSFPQLVVVPIRGGRALEPLAKHPHLIAVGGIGWSPTGDRLAFEAIDVSSPERSKGIWTIRPNGRDLQLVLRVPTLGADDQPFINNSLGWTRRGILYSDGTDLRAASAGRSRLVLRNVSSIRIAGNHRRIVVVRNQDTRRPPAAWVARADGTQLKRVLVYRPAGETPVTLFYDVIPNYDASQVLSLRITTDTESDRSRTEVVRWHTAERPSSATVIEVAEGNYTASWN